MSILMPSNPRFMTRQLPWRAVLGLCALLVPQSGIAQPIAPARDAAPVTQGSVDRSSDVTETAKLLRQGEEAYENGKFQQAYEYFYRAWTRKKTYDVAAFVGSAELRTGRYRDACEHLSYALRMLPPTTPLGPEKSIREKLAEARIHVGAIRIRTNIGGASVRIDGRPTDALWAPDEVFVESGIRSIELSARGYETATRTLEVSKGETRDVTLDLSPVQAPAPPKVAAVSSSRKAANDVSFARASSVDRPSYVPAYITGSLTVLAGAAGAVFVALSNRAATDAGVRRKYIRDVEEAENPCADPAPTISAGCGYLQTILDDRNRFHDLAVGSFIGAGVAALATGYFIVRPPKVSVGTAPVITTHTAGLTVMGEW